MLDVVIALLPALIVGAVVQGVQALVVAGISMVCAVGFEWLWCLVTRSRNTVVDGSALVTGLLLAMTLPVTVPLWQVVVGNFFAIVVIKAFFGGLGQNIFNPALAGRAFLMLISPMGITRYPSIDGVSSATPLHHMVMPALPEESLLDMFLGNCPGSIGEISALALIVGGVYLVVRKVISPRIPLAYVGTMAVLSLIFHKTDNALLWSAYSVLSGGLLLGAIFMATDYVTSPVTAKGQIIYGVGCGVLTLLLRYFGLFPEGVTYAILLANACVWVIDRFTPPARFGVKKGGGKK
jgi:electron transport complex protein RnfD